MTLTVAVLLRTFSAGSATREGRGPGEGRMGNLHFTGGKREPGWAVPRGTKVVGGHREGWCGGKNRGVARGECLNLRLQGIAEGGDISGVTVHD